MQDEVGIRGVAGRVLGLLKAHPDGLRLKQLREMLSLGSTQQHFDRRIRDLRKVYELELTRVGIDDTLYKLGPPKPKAPDLGHVPEKLRAVVLHAAHGRCQMCGLTVAQDGIKLQADHKIPSAWGGRTDLENLWALCEKCNRGKRDYFSSFNDADMSAVVGLASVHERIAKLLKLHLGSPVSADVLEFVANAPEQQQDWQKRLRELRYLGLEIVVSKKKINGRVKSFYTLNNWIDLPPDHVRRIKEHERRASPSR